jgi:hypothetical protein
MPKQDLKTCIDIIANASDKELSPDQAKRLIDQIMSEVNRPSAALDNAEAKVRELGKQIIGEDKVLSAIQRRNALLTVIANNRIHDYVKKFPTMGEGLMTFMNGSNKLRAEGRLSVYYQGRSLQHKYVGRLVDGLQKTGTMPEFKSTQIDRQIFQELWELGKEGGKPGISGSPKAQAIAKIVHDINMEMIDRENRAGAFVNKLEGYVMRQSHDADAIRRAGGMGYGPGSNEASFKVWSDFIMPLLDERTFEGVEDKTAFLRGAHEGIITGVHDRPTAEIDINAAFRNTGALAKRVSQGRTLHFKDADSAFRYNHRFGMKEFRESVLRQIQMRANATAMMENFGPNPEITFERLVRDMKSTAKKTPDDVAHLKSLDDWRLQASFRELMGYNDVSTNPSLSRIMNSIRAIQNMAKLGQSTITAFADKAFLQSEMGFQGMDALRTASKQFTAIAEGRPEGERRSMLNLMGAGLDGFMGSVMHRFSMHDNRAGTLFKMQAHFFNLNAMNWWNDVHKGAAAELMSAHLAEHADLPHAKLPVELRNVLSLYGIDQRTWDLVRATASEVEGRKYITPDGLLQIPTERIKAIMAETGEKYTVGGEQRFRDRLDTQLRTYFADRVDIAIPTPGNEERVYSHWNTQAGTPLGEGVRMLMMFKQMPISVLQKVVKREIYGHGSDTLLQWLQSDRLGNFRMIQLIAMTAVGGYISGAIKDAIRGKTPKPLTPLNIQDALLRGGGLGIYGDMLFTEYDRSYRSFTSTMGGPVISQVDTLADMANKLKHGESIAGETGKLVTNNIPFINLFYIRPVLDYLILWNLQEMGDPGSLRRAERKVERDTGQGFFIRPSEHVTQ